MYELGLMQYFKILQVSSQLQVYLGWWTCHKLGCFSDKFRRKFMMDEECEEDSLHKWKTYTIPWWLVKIKYLQTWLVDLCKVFSYPLYYIVMWFTVSDHMQ